MYNNRSLFSDYYLEELVGEDSHWRALKNKAAEYRQRIGDILRKAIPGINGNTPEAEVERRLIRPVLDALGHVYFVQPAVPSSEGVRRPDYAFFPSPEAQQGAESHKGELEFFKTALAVGDAKAWERSLDKRVKGPGDPFTNHNPSYQIDFYLRATERKWGLLTNGRYWRLYHRDLSYRLDVYYEVDLSQVVTLDEDAFLYFLAFFHKEAFQPDGAGECFLDRAYRASTDYAAKVSEELKDNVYEALRLLAEGLVAFPGNGLTAQDLDLVRENAFIVIYRLLFILYAEAREFLPVANPTYLGTYSLRALTREIATKEPFEANLHPTAISYWSRLQELFRLINNGDEFLHIPPYNGRLFDDQKEHQRLATWKIGDRYLAAAIDQLARARAAGRTGRGFVSYRDLSIRELGSIYEGLLEHRPRYATQDVVVVKEDKRERFVPLAELGNRKALKSYRAGSVYLETDRGERKATGSYYTPQYIVEYIVKNTLGPLLEEAKKSDGNLIDAILALKVLDPAMGSGHFLVEATDYLARALVEALGGDPREMEEDEIRWARREVVERCIYGVDLNPLAVDLAKLSLWLSTVSLDKPLNFLDHHLRCGNSLIGARLEDLGQLPVLGKKKAAKAAPASQTLLEYYFHQNVATAVDNYFRIATMSSDKIQHIRDKEQLYGIARDILKRYRQVAHIWTSAYFGNQVPAEGYMGLQDKIRAPDPEWAELEKQPWFVDGVKMGEEERRFFHWELEFPEVFFDRNGQRLQNAGFSAVVGNPPYEVLSVQETRDPDVQRLIEFFAQVSQVAKGKQNLYRLMVERSYSLLPVGAFFGFIIPATILADQTAARLRGLLLQNSAKASFYVFPESARVFEEVTQAVCVTITQRGKALSAISLTTDLMGADNLQRKEPFRIPIDALKLIDPNNLSIPAVSQSGWIVLQKIHRWPALAPVKGVALADIFQGEVNLTVFAHCLRAADTGTLLVRGDHLGRYAVRLDRIASEEGWLDKSKYIAAAGGSAKAQHHLQERLAFQEVANMQLERRLNCSCIPRNVFLGHTANYLCNFSADRYYLLAVLNSTLMNWRFKVTSTNNHVSGDEARALPIRRINFTTPEAERERLVAEGKGLYQEYLQSKDWGKVLSFIGQRLPQKPDGSPDTEREQSDAVHDLLALLAEEMTRLHKEKQSEVKGLLTWLEGYLGIGTEDLKNKTKIREYWKAEVGWAGFASALEQNRRAIQSAKGIDVTRREPQEAIRAEFEASVAKLTPLLERIQLTDRLIDQIVYKLYGLTEEEIAIVEGRG